MKVSLVSIAALGLVVGLLGSAAQAAMESNAQDAVAPSRPISRAIELANPVSSLSAEVAKTPGAAQVAWCYWYRDGYNRPCQ
jgi:hypothetical protein